MARLLILLACARVAAGVMDALDIKAVCEVPTDGGPRKIYLDMDAAAVETLAGPPGPDNEMSLPIETTDCEPFKSAYINFSLSEAPEQASCEDVRLRVRLNFDPRHAIDARSPARHRRDSRAGRGLAQDRRAGQGLHLGRDADAHPRVLRVQLSTPDPGHHACP